MNHSATIQLSEYRDVAVELSTSDADFLADELSDKISIHRDVRGPYYVLNARQFVGVIRLPSGRHVQIYPKIPISNLFYMLAVAFQFPPYIRKEMVNLNRLEEILEFVASYFADLVEERIGNGLYRWYVEREANLPALRGRISFFEDIRQNYILRQRTFCRFDEFTWDVPENQIVRQVLHLLSGWSFRPVLRFRLGQLDSEMHEVSLTRFVPDELDKIHYHRLNEDYRQLHQLCRLFLEGASLTEELGIFNFRAFLVDMNKLFEKFVGQLLQESVPPEYHVDLQESIYLDSRRKIAMRPDILIRHEGALAVVADCKYKVLEDDEFKNHDTYQLLAYCVATGTSTGLLIYPGVPTDEERTQIQNSEIIVRQVRLDLGASPNRFVDLCQRFTETVFKSAFSGELIV